jgi:hypothetical protein
MNFLPNPWLETARWELMPRYFFDLWEDEALPEDRERVEFPSVKAVKAEAPVTLPAIAQGYLSKGDHKYLEIRIRDEAKSQLEGGLGSCYQAPEQA